MPANPDLIPGILQRWAKGQIARLRQAFKVGGHQLHGGATWVPLKPTTGLRTPLNKTGALAASVFVTVSGVSVLIGAAASYAIYHQNGTRSIPRRMVIDLTRTDLEMLKRDLKRTLES